MSNRPFVAARVEMAFDRRVESLFRMLGWRERVIAYTGYGNEDAARVVGRVVLVPHWSDSALGKAAEELLRRRGWRNFLSAACVHSRYTVTFGDAEVKGTTDRGGYIDHRVTGHAEDPGWRRGEIRTDESEPTPVAVRVIPRDETFGIVSDIDDTILSTMLPRPFIAAWNSFFRTESARQAVPGMAVLYQELQDLRPDAPVVYVSTGAWNTHGFLARFLDRHRYPLGPMLLTDWGPTNTGWFRSGQEHKRNALLQLSVDFPAIRWLLVGDDGQHDPQLYTDFARANPDRVRAVAIRELTPAEQFLAHGTAEPIETAEPEPEAVPVLRAPDGRGLHDRVLQVLGLTPRSSR